MRKPVRLIVAGALVVSGIMVGHTGNAGPANTIGGVVWLDANGDGLRGEGEPGVPGLPVVVKDGKGNQVGAATSDSGGKYGIEVPAGTLTVCFGLSAVYADYAFTKPASGCTAPLPPGSGTMDAGITPPPNKIGGAIWVDVNKNGLHDGAEPPVPGVTVIVWDGTGKQMGSSTTDKDGRYRVDNLPDGTFTVCFGTATLPDAYADHLITRPNAGDDITDSDADPATGCTTPVNLGPDNRENLTVDAGILAPSNRLGDYVWIDGNRNGLQDVGEPGMFGVSVVLQAGGEELARTATNANGRYLFDNVPDGYYRVCFDLTTLPAAAAGYTVTPANVGGDDVDSDADPAGCTPTTALGVGRRANLTLDAGLVAR